jgi:CheY-like chemotaxis protein/glycine cleavage system H lipoate-binding protein
MVIDDEEIVHASVQRILTRSGFEAEAVFSAAEALARLRAGRFDLVITDLMMPGMNGMQLLAALRDEGISIPVVLVTGLPTLKTAVQALRMGATDYIAKPFRRDELLNPLFRALAAAERSLDPSGAPPGCSAGVGDLREGVVLALPHHSWARSTGRGMFEVGVVDYFIRSCGSIAAVELPRRMDIVEQGYPGVWIEDEAGRRHGVAMPLSGKVLEVNDGELSREPPALGETTWVMRILAYQVEVEVGHLVVERG